MGLFNFLYDDSGKKKRLIPYPGFQDIVETVSGSAKTEFTLGITIDADHKIDVSVDGRGQPIEDTHWSRDTDNGKITMTEAVNVGSVFKARIYLK